LEVEARSNGEASRGAHAEAADTSGDIERGALREELEKEAAPGEDRWGIDWGMFPDRGATLDAEVRRRGGGALSF